MAGADALMFTYFQRYIVPLAVFFIGLRLLLFILGKIYPSYYVWLCMKIAGKHHKFIKKHKDKLFSEIASLREENQRFFALEIGCGPGKNFDIYPPNTSLIVVEPNTKFEPLVAKNAAQYPAVEVAKFLAIGAENLRDHVENDSQDVVVCTFSLCSMRDADAVVREARRVLKPGGRFYFVEHTRAHTRNSWTHVLQRMCAPFIYVFGGCMLCQTPWVTLDRAGFSEVHYTKMNVGLTGRYRIFGPHLFGYAVK